MQGKEDASVTASFIGSGKAKRIPSLNESSKAQSVVRFNPQKRTHGSINQDQHRKQRP
jgi:hypothetical protein